MAGPPGITAVDIDIKVKSNEEQMKRVEEQKRLKFTQDKFTQES